ncbi:MAG: DUF3788 domain-containing protein [Cellulomonadaceae bacterium]|jgi:hypothetical protein|nr:DUF3788 domain-containing protein [Cellulomonadaceae bacterium]
MANAFTHPDVAPTAETVADALGVALPAWEALQEALAGRGVTPAWRFYRDGGWLIKAVKGSRTVLWASIADEAVDGGIYFAERLRDDVTSAPGITPALADQIRAAQPLGRTFPVPFTLRTLDDVDALLPVVDARLALK